jgi:hypothetical protein
LPFEPPGPLEPVPRRLVVEVPSDGQIAARPRGNRFISTHERLDRYETLAARKPGYQAMYFVIDAGMISSIFGQATPFSRIPFFLATFWPVSCGDPDIPRWTRKTQQGQRRGWDGDSLYRHLSTAWPGFDVLQNRRPVPAPS